MVRSFLNLRERTMSDGVLADHEIADFWKAHILGALWEKRPRALDFSLEDVSDATGLEPVEDVSEFFDDVADWMIGENLIALRANERIEGQIFSVRLTSKGEALMQKQADGWTGVVVAQAGSALKKVPGALATGAVGLGYAAIRAFITAAA